MYSKVILFCSYIVLKQLRKHFLNLKCVKGSKIIYFFYFEDDTYQKSKLQVLHSITVSPQRTLNCRITLSVTNSVSILTHRQS